MANNYKRWLCKESLNPPFSRPILIQFEFRSKPSLITVICIWTLNRPTNCFLILGDDTSFFFFISLFFVVFVVVVILCHYFIFTKIILLLLFYFIYLFIFFLKSCSGMFRNVPCSWLYRRPCGWRMRMGKCGQKNADGKKCG